MVSAQQGASVNHLPLTLEKLLHIEPQAHRQKQHEFPVVSFSKGCPFHHLENDILYSGMLNYPHIFTNLSIFDGRFHHDAGYKGINVFYGRLPIANLVCIQNGVDATKYSGVNNNPWLIEHPIQVLVLGKSHFLIVGNTRTLVRYERDGEDALQPMFLIKPRLRSSALAAEHYHHYAEMYENHPNNKRWYSHNAFPRTNGIYGMWVNPPTPKTF